MFDGFKPQTHGFYPSNWYNDDLWKPFYARSARTMTPRAKRISQAGMEDKTWDSELLSVINRT
jgi:hypothetical protein